MKFSVIIPAFNEEKTILKLLERLNETKVENIEYEFIVINDGSTDDTKNLLENNKNLFSTLINNNKNLGKGYSVREGLKIAKGEFVGNLMQMLLLDLDLTLVNTRDHTVY